MALNIGKLIILIFLVVGILIGMAIVPVLGVIVSTLAKEPLTWFQFWMLFIINACVNVFQIQKWVGIYKTAITEFEKKYI